MTNPFDTPDGSKALEIVGWPRATPPPPEHAAATLAMIKWLFAQHPLLSIEKFPDGKCCIHILRPESPTYPILVREFIGQGDTLEEGLVAAVLATPAPEVRTEGEKGR